MIFENTINLLEKKITGRGNKMVNTIERCDDEIRTEDELKKEDKMVTNIIGEKEDTICIQKKRKICLLQPGNSDKARSIEDIIEKPSSNLSCSFCSKKLKITSNYTCRCGNVFCVRHRFHDQHNCTFDYKTGAKAKLEAENPRVCKKMLGDL